jgi:glycerophosphoryl diester phosphodiesterase
MKRLAPGLPRGLTADRFADPSEGGGAGKLRRFALRHLLSTPLVRPAFVSYGLADLPATAPLFLRHLGWTLITWTVRSPAERAKALGYVDQITFEGFDPDATGTAPAAAARSR